MPDHNDLRRTFESNPVFSASSAPCGSRGFGHSSTIEKGPLLLTVVDRARTRAQWTCSESLRVTARVTCCPPGAANQDWLVLILLLVWAKRMPTKRCHAYIWVRRRQKKGFNVH